MNIIFSALIVILIVLLFTIFAAWIDKFNAKHKESFIETIIDRKEAFIDKALEKVLDKTMDQHDSVAWFLVVYTQDSNYPICISNNNIRSVHPDPANNKISVKQFCNEDMVIEKVISYELCPGNALCDYDM